VLANHRRDLGEAGEGGRPPAPLAGDQLIAATRLRTNEYRLQDAASAKGLRKAGVMDQVTLREFDRLCVPPVEPLKPKQIKQIREASRVSQAVFAALLNTSLSTVHLALLKRAMHFSGVSLNDQASLLLEFQNSYQASAQMISTISTMLQTLFQTMNKV